MAMIHLARDGANIGSFSTEEIREGLRTGRFWPTDMAWQEGMPDWRPLAQVVADKPAAAPPVSGTIVQQSMGVMGSGQNPIANMFGIGIGILFFIVLVPVMIVVGMFVISGILHLCLMIVGGARKPFETTFRVVRFSSGH